MSPLTLIPEEIRALYEVRERHHAAAILAVEFPVEFREICEVLGRFRLTEKQIKAPGGNESEIPKAFNDLLRPLGWREENLRAKMVVDEQEVSSDTHKIDYVKNRIALDLEWNSKDQTFDRDLFAFRTFFDYGKISVGVLITRSNDLDPFFVSLGSYKDKHGKERTYKSKFGASTTHMGKLLPRLDAGRSGGCPVLVFGITPKLIRRP